MEIKICEIFADFDPLFLLLPKTLNYLAFQSFDFERA
jgi:hypothetical protein